jgi:hypothetical protein
MSHRGCTVSGVERSHITELQRLASTQLGLFAGWQAGHLDSGLSWRALAAAADRGWLRRVRRDVYAFTGYPRSRWEGIVAAVLAAGPNAVISHTAAATIHRFVGIAPSGPSVTAVGRTGKRLHDVRMHYATYELPAEDVQPWWGVKITSPIRTLIDIVPQFGDHLLGKLIDEGTIAKLWTPERIDRRLAGLSRPGRQGVERLRGLLLPRLDEANVDSVLEQRVIRVLDGQVPPFEVHLVIVVGGRVFEMDIAWPEHLIDGEVDGFSVRKTSRSKFEGDRVGGNLLLRHGWRRVHFTSAMSDRTILTQVVPLFPRDAIDKGLWADIVGD